MLFKIFLDQRPSENNLISLSDFDSSVLVSFIYRENMAFYFFQVLVISHCLKVHIQI